MDTTNANNSLYTPLRNSNTIRLFKISRGDDASTIAGQLEAFELDSSCPDFMSVSYVWGPKLFSKAINLNGYHLPVLQDLYPLLKLICDYQDSSRGFWWWIDSICINQDDARERSSQVQLMGRIYRRAKRIIVWLGEESEDSADAISFLHLLKKKRWEYEYDNGAGIQELRKPEFDPKWRAVNNLLLRPWWTRVWTLQEFIIPRELSFYCGRNSIRRLSFQSAVYGIWLCRGSDGTLTGHLSRKAFGSAWNRRRLLMWYNRSQIYFEDDESVKMSLLAMMAYVGNCKATDPRDRIYSLLGLAKDHGLVGRADYDSAVDVVYSELVKSFVDRYQSLDIICFAHLFNYQATDPTTDPAVPSWVPDWRAEVEPLVIPLMASQSAGNHIGNHRPMSVVTFTAYYAAAGAHAPRTTFSKDLRTLTCEGIFVDYIDGIGGLKDECRAWTGIQERERHSHLCVQSTSPRNYPTRADYTIFQDNELQTHDHSDFIETISRSLVLDRVDRYLGDPAPPGGFRRELQAFCKAAVERPVDVHPLFLDWFQRNKSLFMRGHALENLLKTAQNPLLSDLTDFMDMSVSTTFLARFRDTIDTMARRLAVTNDGHIGMVPCRARKGDVVSVLLGCCIPVVLRKRENEDSYEFVGECYLHGLMNGEILKQVDSKRRKMESFRLS